MSDFLDSGRYVGSHVMWYSNILTAYIKKQSLSKISAEILSPREISIAARQTFHNHQTVLHHRHR
jgi:hypothetical protein